MKIDDELVKIRERYKRRENINKNIIYNHLNSSVWKSLQERQRGILNYLNLYKKNVNELRLLEIGCGGGGNLLELLRLGFQPENLVGNDLLSERLDEARHKLPNSINLIKGDASSINYRNNSFDIIYQSTMFTSILDNTLQQNIANKIWDLLKPGGACLWYDFKYNNPNNSDVQGIKLRRIKQLFPNSRISFKRVTLAPPISRFVCNIHPFLYDMFNIIPFLRTHLLCWISK